MAWLVETTIKVNGKDDITINRQWFSDKGISKQLLETYISTIHMKLDGNKIILTKRMITLDVLYSIMQIIKL